MIRWITCDTDCRTKVVDVEDDGPRNPDSAGLGDSVVVTVGLGKTSSTHRNSRVPAISTAPTWVHFGDNSKRHASTSDEYTSVELG